MKKSIFITGLLALSFYGCGQTALSDFTCLQQKEAEKVLGEPAKLTESKSAKNKGVQEYQCTYTALAMDSSTGKTGIIYYMAEDYSTAEDAHKTLAHFSELNKQAGWKYITGVGDEATSHTDGENFQMVMVRKGNRLVRLKINKVTRFTASIETLQALAKEIADRL